MDFGEGKGGEIGNRSGLLRTLESQRQPWKGDKPPIETGGENETMDLREFALLFNVQCAV